MLERVLYCDDNKIILSGDFDLSRITPLTGFLIKFR